MIATQPARAFAFVCAGKWMVQGAAEAFLQGEVEVDPGRREVRLSKILKVSHAMPACGWGTERAWGAGCAIKHWI